MRNAMYLCLALSFTAVFAPVPHNKQILKPEVFDEEDKVTEAK